MNEFEEAVKQTYPLACCRNVSTHLGPQKLGADILHTVWSGPTADASPIGSGWSERAAWQVAYNQIVLNSDRRANVTKMLNEMKWDDLWGRLSDDTRRRLYAFVISLEGSG